MKNLRVLLPLSAFALALAGCGGSGSTTTTDVGAVRLAINWPESTRLIPSASNSITVSFIRNSTVIASQTVARPDTGDSTTVSFADLPATTLTMRAQAFPSTNGTGVAQASASKSITVVADTTIDAGITMASTIASMSVSPSISNLAIGATKTLVGTPMNANGGTVLVSTATASWTSSNTAVATVSNTGVVTAVAAGTTTITFADSESGKSGTATVNVSSGTGDADVVIK